jgi:hypothetical protein
MFDRYDDGDGATACENNVRVGVDEFGFYIWLQPEGKASCAHIDFVSICTRTLPASTVPKCLKSDPRPCQRCECARAPLLLTSAQDIRILTDFEYRHGRDGLEQRLIMICSGQDYVNTQYMYLCAHDGHKIAVGCSSAI